MTNNDNKPFSTIARYDDIIDAIKEERISKSKASSSDEDWAMSLLNYSWFVRGGRETRFLDAVCAGYLWRVAYAIKLNNEMSDTERFITKKVGRQALKEAKKAKHYDVIDYLISSNFAMKYGFDDNRPVVTKDNDGDILCCFSLKKLGIDIMPSIDDKEWALDFFNFACVEEKEELAKKFIVTAHEGHLWRIAYAIYFDQKLDKEDKFITWGINKWAINIIPKTTCRKTVERLLSQEQNNGTALSSKWTDISKVKKRPVTRVSFGHKQTIKWR